jgi:hypothetical protein
MTNEQNANENEQIDNNNETIDNVNDEIANQGSAGDGTPEDTLTKMEQLVKQQEEQIAEQAKQNDDLRSQISKLIRSGATIGSVNSTEDNEPKEKYVPLSDLGAEFGKY